MAQAAASKMAQSSSMPSSSPPTFWHNVTRPVPFATEQFLHLLSADAFPEEAAKQWIHDRFPLTFQVSLLYVLVVFGTKFLMRNRPPFALFVPLNAWNLLLAVFSTIGTAKLAPEFFSTLFNHGFQASYCNVHEYTAGNNGFWVWLFITSKMFELVDTVFLVLRKRPLLFLHWYHHILTMMYAFYSYPIMPAFNRWGIFLNYFVHSYMYSYYFLRSMKIRVPGAVARFVTTIQIWQFIISVAILVHLGWLVYAQNVKCDMDGRVYAYAVGMDVSYLVLFINFFLHAYVFGGGKDKYRAADKKKNDDVDMAYQQKQQELLKQQQNGGTGMMSNGAAVRRVG